MASNATNKTNTEEYCRGCVANKTHELCRADAEAASVVVGRAPEELFRDGELFSIYPPTK